MRTCRYICYTITKFLEILANITYISIVREFTLASRWRESPPGERVDLLNCQLSIVTELLLASTYYAIDLISPNYHVLMDVTLCGLNARFI